MICENMRSPAARRWASAELMHSTCVHIRALEFDTHVDPADRSLKLSPPPLLTSRSVSSENKMDG
jgi:hypothetical protein